VPSEVVAQMLLMLVRRLMANGGSMPGGGGRIARQLEDETSGSGEARAYLEATAGCSSMALV
jgi:hypothetical protein